MELSETVKIKCKNGSDQSLADICVSYSCLICQSTFFQICCHFLLTSGLNHQHLLKIQRQNVNKNSLELSNWIVKRLKSRFKGQIASKIQNRQAISVQISFISTERRMWIFYYILKFALNFENIFQKSQKFWDIWH